MAEAQRDSERKAMADLASRGSSRRRLEAISGKKTRTFFSHWWKRMVRGRDFHSGGRLMWTEATWTMLRAADVTPKCGSARSERRAALKIGRSAQALPA